MKKIFAILAFGFIALLGEPLIAQIHVGVGIKIGPPTARREVIVKRPHKHAVWIPGHWNWKPALRNYDWISGHWATPPHRRAVWIEGTWKLVRGEWVYFEGHWK